MYQNQPAPEAQAQVQAQAQAQGQPGQSVVMRSGMNIDQMNQQSLNYQLYAVQRQGLQLAQKQGSLSPQQVTAVQSVQMHPI